MLGCLRKISSVIQKNERRIEEHNRVAEQQKQSSQAAQIVSTNLRDLLTRFVLKIPYLRPPESAIKTVQLKPLLPPEIVELLTNTKNKYCEMFQVNLLIRNRSLFEEIFF
jgi:hypothetical protein